MYIFYRKKSIPSLVLQKTTDKHTRIIQNGPQSNCGPLLCYRISIKAATWLNFLFLGEFESEANAVNEADLLVEVTAAAGGVDDLIFFFEGLVGHGYP